MPLRDNDDPPLRRTPDQKRSQSAETRSADDLRVQPFTDDVFSEYHTRRKEAGAPFGLIAGVVIGVAAVAGIGWYLWNTGALGGGGPVDGVPQLVKANSDPYKVKPENPGGMQVENQDKLVYDRVAKGEAPPRVENLLPAPEEPKAPPKPAAPPPEAVKPEAPPVETAKAEPPPAEAAKPVEAAKPEPAKEVAKAEPAKPAAPAKADQDDLASLVAAATGGREAATGPINTKPGAAPAAQAPAPEAPAPQTQVAAAPLVAVPAPAPAAAPPAVSPAAMAGAFQIQLASARSEQGAMGEWNRIVGKNKDALAGLTPNVARVDLGEKGVFFRLRAGPLKDKAAADAVCSALGAQNVGCIVVRP